MPGAEARSGVKTKPRDAKGALRRILRYLMAYRWLVLLFLAGTLLSNLGNLLGPQFAGKAIGVVEEGYRQGPGHVDMALVSGYALSMLVCYVLGSGMSFLVSIGMMRVGRRVARNMRQDVFQKLMALPVGYFDRHQAGDIINRAAAEAYRDADGMGMSMGPTVGMISNFGLAAIGLGGSILYMMGVVGLAQISSFVLYSRKFSGPINEISNIINEIFSALAASERVFRLLDEPEEVKDIYGAATLESCRGQVQAEDVSFGYEPGKTVLHHLDFEAQPGQTIAIVGPTGAGKTTIINLLMRFYDPDQGGIYVDGTEHRVYTMESLRRSYAMVLQDTWVFRGTIFDNIAYGKQDASMEEVVQAAKAARIHSYVMRLPQGYHTVISEDGGNISKGQKQLLTIARAMLYDTHMLILDEATSNVDTNTERQVQTAIRSLMTGKTCFVIAHRLSTIQNADHILVVDHGDVVEQGTHEQLMDQKGFYYRLYASQFG